MATTTKLDSYAVLGASDAAATTTKLDSYAVLSPSNTAVTATKTAAYAVLVAADSFESVSKVTGYAVVETSLGASNTKLSGYAVLGTSTSAVTTTKAAAYAVLGAADSFESVSKITCYAVVEMVRVVLTAGNTDMNNQFKVIRPTAINDARLISSTVAEADYATWAAGTFAVGTRRIMTTGVHRIYECLVAHTSTNDTGKPNLNVTGLTPKWLDISPTNRWGMFDAKINTTTTATDSMTVVLQTGRINSLALLQVDAAAVDVDLRVGGVLVYSATTDLTGGGTIGDWYQYFYEPVYQRDSVVITNLLDAALVNLPAYSEGVLTVTLRRTGGTVSCGVLVVGLYAEIGMTEYRPKVGINDFSRKTTDVYGNVDITVRGYSKRMDAVTTVARGAVDQVTRTLAQYRSTPMVWVGAGNLYTSMIVYGFYKDWDMVIENHANSRLTLQVEGLV